MSDVQNINYQPLEAGQHAYRLMLKQYRFQTAAVIVVSIGLCFLLLQSGFFVAIFWFMILLMRANAYRNKVWVSFANANDWPVNALDDALTIIPTSLQFGHSQNLSPAISAIIGQTDTDMLVYSTSVGGGRNEHTYSFTLARVELPVTLPHILLRAKNDHAALQQDFEDHETLQLEGDFQDYFSLQIEKGQEVNALEILTPDVMQTLVSYSQRENIEIMGNRLYFIIDGDARAPERIRQLVQSVVELSGQIGEYVRQTTLPQTQPVG